ncbi:MAG TPA: DUF4856 domain-containing protein [Cytophagales bacterium]|nr:DUF4856 domain-containing protein [Cytophagales bacterium]
MKLTKNYQPLIYFFIAVAIATFSSCSEDDDPKGPSYQVPDTYAFENAAYNGQTVRIQLLDSLGKLINSAKTNKVTQAQLLAVYENQNSLFGGNQKLSDKTAPGTDTQIREWFELVEENSPMAEDKRGTKGWFITPNGLDVSQLVQKTLMGSVFYYQATSTYLDGIENDNNTAVGEEGYTEMEHHWDEAFGYYGAPKDFSLYTAEDILVKYRDTNGDGIQNIPDEKYYFHAGYSVTRDEGAKNFPEAEKVTFRKNLMDNFIKGRAAISNKDGQGREEAKEQILVNWEKQIAASAIHYFKAVKEKIEANSEVLDDVYSTNHEWSEGRGFLNSLNYNNNSIITAAQWNEIDALVGDQPSETTPENLSLAVEKIQTIYGFSDYQTDNF